LIHEDDEPHDPIFAKRMAQKFIVLAINGSTATPATIRNLIALKKLADDGNPTAFWTGFTIMLKGAINGQ
jgi:hypothetical protein